MVANLSHVIALLLHDQGPLLTCLLHFVLEENFLLDDVDGQSLPIKLEWFDEARVAASPLVE